MEDYLNSKMKIFKRRVIAPIKMFSKKGLTIFYKKIKYNLDAEANCTICNYQIVEDIFHFYIRYPIYPPHRKHYPSKYIKGINIDKFFIMFDKEKIDNLHNKFT